jgi:NDP-sugar pyrophosphorylase family protein
MMRAVILAAGRGSRMGHLGDDRPKCLVELEGKPLIERQIAALRRGGVDEIGVVRGYRAEMIDFPASPISQPRWAETNMVMSLAAAAPWLRSGPVIVSYADIFYRSELVRGLAAALRASWSSVTTGPGAACGPGVSPILWPTPKLSGSMPRASCWRSAARRRGSKISRGNIWAS